MRNRILREIEESPYLRSRKIYFYQILDKKEGIEDKKIRRILSHLIKEASKRLKKKGTRISKIEKEKALNELFKEYQEFKKYV